MWQGKQPFRVCKIRLPAQVRERVFKPVKIILKIMDRGTPKTPGANGNPSALPCDA